VNFEIFLHGVDYNTTKDGVNWNWGYYWTEEQQARKLRSTIQVQQQTEEPSFCAYDAAGLEWTSRKSA
jgi:hypothetical protein